jgi:hypothetical protein
MSEQDNNNTETVDENLQPSLENQEQVDSETSSDVQEDTNLKEKEVDLLRSEIKELKEALIFANSKKEEPKKEEEYSNADDLVTFAELEKRQKQKDEEYRMTIQEIKIQQQYPDYRGGARGRRPSQERAWRTLHV